MRKKMFIALLFCIAIFRSNAQSTLLEKNKVMDYFQNQQYDDAINYLLPLAANDSNNIELLGLLGYASYINENTGAAEKYFLKIFELDSNSVSAIQYLSAIYSKQKTPQALALTYRLINLQPAKSSNYRQMGDLFRRLNAKDSTLFYYQEAYRLAPGDTKNETALADMLIDQKKFTSADSILDPALIKDSVNTRLMELRIKSAYEAKDFQSAILPGERLMKVDGIFAAGLTQLALSYYFLKRYSHCVRVCNFLEGQGVVSESLFYYEARAQAKLKNYETSNELLEKCITMAISSTAESYYYDLGENYEALSKYKKAITQYDTAYYLFKNPVMNYNSGRIAESNLRNAALAKKYYTLYLHAANPQSEDEKKAYAYVKAKWSKQRTKPSAKK